MSDKTIDRLTERAELISTKPPLPFLPEDVEDKSLRRQLGEFLEQYHTWYYAQARKADGQP